MIQLIVFDIAGTTVHDNQNVHQALQKALLNQGVETSLQEINPFMGIPKPIAIKVLLERHLEDKAMITNAFIEQIHQDFLTYMIDFYKNAAEVRPKDNAEKVFHLLKAKGIKIALDTGFSRIITDTIIQRLGWQNLIDASVSSDEVAQGRPQPDMIFKAMELLNIKDINTVAKIGDTEVDIQQGKSAGCKFVIGITTGAYTREDLAKEAPTHLIDDLEELLAIVS